MDNQETMFPLEKNPFLSDKTYFWFGLVGLLSFPLLIFLLVSNLIMGLSSVSSLLYPLLFIVVISLVLIFSLVVFIFYKITKALKVTEPSWRKALFLVGIIPIFSLFISFFKSINFLYYILWIVSIVFWIIIAQKVYMIKVGKAIASYLSLVFSFLIAAFLIGTIFGIISGAIKGYSEKVAQQAPATIPISSTASTSVKDSSWVEYKNDELGFSFEYPIKYGEIVIKKTSEGEGFIYEGSFSKGIPDMAPGFFGGKSINNQNNNHDMDYLDDTVSNYGDKIKISDISGVNTTGIIVGENPQKDLGLFKDSIIKYWREVIFNGNKKILNLVFSSRLDHFPEYLDIVKTVKIY